MFQSTKLFDGYSTCFRQWKAEGTHCKFLHGYAVSFKITFEGDLDDRNWVFDFGGMKRAKNKIQGMTPTDFFAWMFDHTTVIAADDPELSKFEELEKAGVLNLRVIPRVGCERFAEFILQVVNEFLQEEYGGRVKAVKVEVFENLKNSASALA